MEHLFAYGMLSNPAELKKIIGRDALGSPDRLYGYEYKEKMVLSGENYYPGIEVCDELFVDGVVYDVYAEELSLIDQSQGGTYERKKVRLDSNIDAFAYIPDHLD